MPNYITVDVDTTNTRISLVKNNEIIETLKYSAGVKDGREALCAILKNGIAEILKKHNLTESDIEIVLASGMLTSELGLIELSHILLPAGIKELRENMYFTEFPEICAIPFGFIRGVKYRGEGLENIDIIRGEETELAGLFEGKGIYVLPGSHSKIIEVSEAGEITAFKTMLTGEMIAALSQNTILKEAINLNTAVLDVEYLKNGYLYACKNGINNALFRVRILKKLENADNNACYSFFLGAVLQGEIEYILSLTQEKIIIGGKRALRQPMAVLLKAFSNKQIIELAENQTKSATTLGAIKIFEYVIIN